ncbi:DUF4349 domain-containing protein [Bacillus sp. EB01]|uniref:DUF4349 domain-containing protein n=1 Tax=Bacillus sp. EB01 TaxID=1347086 RepID=UPI0005C68AA0|nr:DUF4349 domain-containing protein [Bacillus sp. EB01]
MAVIKRFFFLLVSLLLAILVSCSSSDTSESGMDRADSGKSEKGVSGNEIGEVERNNASKDSTDSASPEGNELADRDVASEKGRMVIHEAELHLRVKDFAEAQQSLETKAKQYGGFIVDSTVSRDGGEGMSGAVTIRVPASQFEKFLHEAEKEAAEVIERVVRGDDVTEDYVDLESRLKSKRAVEARLLDFMKGAERTEDLLKISSDLAVVQEEIEQLVGKMKYLKDRASLSTITISFFETKVVVSGTTPKELNTWERTKKQFLSSVNMLLSWISGFIVFFFGNLPIILGLAAAGFILFISVKKLFRDKG